jgi:mRNA-degrading endonuclease RelE of RelBE toxin-antitoxin system
MLYFRFSNRFAKRYSDLDAADQARVDRALELLDTNWKHPSLHVKKVQGHEGIWEARVSQVIRLTFQLEGKFQELDVCVLRTVGPHSILKNP